MNDNASKHGATPFGTTMRLSDIVVLVGVAFVIGFSSSFAQALYGSGYLSQPFAFVAARSVGYALLVAIAALVFEHIFIRFLNPLKEGAEPLQGINPKSVFLGSLIIFVCWAIWPIAFYPASMNWDTYGQAAQTFGIEPFSDHHPVFDTLLYGAFAHVSDALTGSWNAGLFAFAFLQCYATALTFSYAFAKLRVFGASRLACRISLVCICVIPAFGHLSSVVIKDMLFSPVFVLYFVTVAELIVSQGVERDGKTFAIRYCVLALLLALTKKTGLYVVVIASLLLALLYRRHWKALVSSAVALAVLVGFLLPSVVHPAFGIASGNPREALGLAFQQSARYQVCHPDDVTAEEHEAIDAVLDCSTLAERYNPFWADPVKYGSSESVTTSEKVDYLKAWASQGLRHPATYVAALIAEVDQYLSPKGVMFMFEDTMDVEHYGSEKLYHPAALEGLREAMVAYYGVWQKTPVLSIALTMVLYVLIIPGFALYYLKRHASNRLSVLIPIGLIILTLLLSPQHNDPRYMLPLLYCGFPLLCF